MRERVRKVIPAFPSHPYTDGDSLDLSVSPAWTIDNVLSPQECVQWIETIDRLGPEPAPITTSRGAVMRPDVRNNTRVMVDDQALANELFSRIRDTVTESVFGGHRAIGLNERWRCYRYAPGQRFAPHFDGAFRRNEREQSLLTLLVYLNDGFVGGETAFLHYDRAVKPEPGMALLFQHMLFHEGREVLSGVKYVLRSDVMFLSPHANS